MNTIFLLYGQAGDYSDRTDWYVAAYTSEAEAKRHETLAQEYADAWHKLDVDERLKLDAKSPYDETFSYSSSTGIQYAVLPVELRTEAPEPVTNDITPLEKP